MRASLTQVRYNVRQRYGCGVLVTSLEETRGLQFDVMVIAGFVDGDSPAGLPAGRSSSAQRERERMERYHLTEHRYLFYQATAKSPIGICISRIREKTEISKSVPSSFLEALRKVVAIEDGRESAPGGVGRNGVFCG